MRRIVLSSLVLMLTFHVFAQTDSTGALTRTGSDTAARPMKKTLAKENISSANDHFMLQLGYTIWQGKPASIRTTGLPRTFNAYFLFDFPFKTNLHWSVAIGPGIATDNIYFSKTNVGIKDNTTTLQFTDLSDTIHFKKYKLSTAYLEAPLELRYSFNAASANSVKIAIGAKVGTLLNAHTKGKNLQSSTGGVLGSYTEKENSKHFFNQNRLSATARIGYSHFSIFGSYAITPLFKEGVAPTIRPVTIGLNISGL